MSPTQHPSSFRDPSGQIFLHEGVLYRQINRYFKEHYDLLMSSGLYERLIQEGLLIPHEECTGVPALSDVAYKIIKPLPVDFISYPYEWCFGQLKDAALVTLRIAALALEYGMTLKDASAYNIQFVHGKPLLIDTLSLEKRIEGKPWIAYRQFCQHFLAPLALAAKRDMRLTQLVKVHLDGIPLDLASRLLPFSTRFSPALLMHIHLHSSSQKRYSNKTMARSPLRMSLTSLRGLIDSLQSAISTLHWKEEKSTWGSYYTETNYSSPAQQHKAAQVTGLLECFKPKTVWDLGANDGFYSRLACAQGCVVMAFDSDVVAVQKNYSAVRQAGTPNLLPLLMDLISPSPALGWSSAERESMLARGPADTIMALALVHHLAIGNNVPLGMIAAFFYKVCSSLIIEFVPKSDSQVKRMLATREDIFSEYTKEGFELAFSRYFTIEKASPIKESERTVYGMKTKPT